MLHPLEKFFQQALKHKVEHGCGGVPYEQSELLIQLIEETNAMRILEIGTGIGYTAACMVSTNPNIMVDTIDKDQGHLKLAEDNWKELNISASIRSYEGKAHEIITGFQTPYDIIFFDAYTPQKKFLPDFERLLNKNGLLLTANLFLNNVTGGKYLEQLQNKDKWETSIIGDTAISKKI
jgi:predicted O-methyltransferase YrrM